MPKAVGYERRMHELALVESLVDAVQQSAGESRVLAVRLEIGERSCVSPDALRFCFDVVTNGTTLEGAQLEIVQVEGQQLRVTELEVRVHEGA